MSLSLSESQSTTLYIYSDGVVVHQSRVMPCPLRRGEGNGQVKVRLEQISDGIEDDSFMLTGPEELLHSVVRRRKTQLGTPFDTMLDSLVGEQLELLTLRPVAIDKVKEVWHKGKLLNFNTGVFVALENDQGEIEWIREPIAKVRTTAKLSELQRFSTQTYIEALLHTHCGEATTKQSKSGTMNVNISYQSRGMDWNIVYDLLLSSDYSSMSVTGKLDVSNFTGINFTRAKIFVVQGYLFPMLSRSRFEEEEEDQPRRLQAHSLRSEPRSQPIKDLAVEAQEFTTYELPQLMDIGYVPEGQSQYVSFFDQPRIDTQYHYELDLRQSAYAYLHIVWMNSKVMGAGFSFPPGRYHVARLPQEEEGDNNNNPMENLGNLEMDAIPVGRLVEMRVNRVTQIRGVKDEVRSVDDEKRVMQQGKVFRSITYRITLFNEFDKRVTVKVLEHLEQDDWTIKDIFYVRNQKKITMGKKLLFEAITKKPNTDIRETRLAAARLLLPPQSKTVIQYTIEYEK